MTEYRFKEAKKAVRSNIYGLIARINKRTNAALSTYLKKGSVNERRKMCKVRIYFNTEQNV